MKQFKNILFPINLDAKNLNYLIKVVEFASSFGGKLHFLYVNDEQAGYRHPTDREDAVALKVKSVVPESLLSGLDVIYATAKGDLGKEIAVYCRENHIDLIIAGHKRRSRLYGAIFDSPDVDIIDAVNVPILIIPKE